MSTALWSARFEELFAEDSSRAPAAFHACIRADFPDVSLVAVKHRLKKMKKKGMADVIVAPPRQAADASSASAVLTKKAADAPSKRGAEREWASRQKHVEDAPGSNMAFDGLDRAYCPKDDPKYLKVSCHNCYDPEDHLAFLEDKQKYIAAFAQYERLDQTKLRQAACAAPTKAARYEVASKAMLDLTWDLKSRPSWEKTARWEVVIFGRTLELCYDVWPDCDVPLQIMLDILNENLSRDQLLLLEAETVEKLHIVAEQKVWPNNPMIGPMLAASAREILRRIDGTSTRLGPLSRMEKMMLNARFMGPLFR